MKFLDEAKVSLHLNHTNCVQVFDLGIAGIVSKPFDPMELPKTIIAILQESAAAKA